MKRLNSYDQYSAILTDFKKDMPRCSTNKVLMRDELTELITAGKLYYEQIGGVLWFFSSEDYFYSAHIYVPAGTPIESCKQDKDVLVELMGKESRYNDQMEQDLLAAGFQKHDKYLEFACQLDDVIGILEEKLVSLRKIWGEYGFVCRKAVRADFPTLHKLWMEKLGRDSYNVLALTETELNDMEQYGRCIVISDANGSICASSNYLKKGKICYSYITATNHVGLGGWASLERSLSAYNEGCSKDVSWAREDNVRSLGMTRSMKTQTGKFYWQFILPASNEIHFGEIDDAK